MITVSLLHCLLLSLVIAASNNTTDQQALLALKDHITYDPSNLLAQNWTSNTSVCNWRGVTCHVNSHRVKSLNLSSLQLTGTIPSRLANLSSLQSLDLSDNQLSGNIPSSIFTLSALKILYLWDNQLSGPLSSFIFNTSSLLGIDLSYNRLSGELPANICNYLLHLEFLYLDGNMFHGKIPSTLSTCKQLQKLSLYFCNLSGTIPKEIGNLTKLEAMYLNSNQLYGEIPHEIGNLPNLEFLVLDSNDLVGVVPATIFNMSAAKTIYLANNTLSGSLPSGINLALPNVELLHLGINNFTGKIPSFITNASKLTALEVGFNSFSGFIPCTIGNLRNLKFLGLSYNHLTSSTPELSFLSCLKNCKKLRVLNLRSNPLDSTLPSSIGNLSVSLEKLYILDCDISGIIPQVICNTSNLIELHLGDNKLTKSIPDTLSRLQELQALNLGKNKLEGPIPDGLCHLAKLFELDLFGNKLSGSMPSCLGNLTSLRHLFLGSNEFTYGIPSTFWNLKDILIVDFSSNSLDGPFSSDIGNLKVVVEIDLSRNNLSGDITATIGGLKDLQFISLGYNRLEGSIPESFGGLTSLVVLNLSNNKISGSIPVSLEKLRYLKVLNLSFNKLEGEIPKGGAFVNFSAASFMGNNLLCGSTDLQVLTCKNNTDQKSRRKMILLEIVLPSSIVLIIVLIVARKWKLIGHGNRRGLSSDGIMSPQEPLRRYSYLELWRATNRFDEINLIGTGSFGSVYRARLQDGMQVAVKVFHQQCERALKISFQTECEVMKSIRHRNLVKILSSCSNGNFKALVLDYMPNGSLEDCLYSCTCIPDVLQRLNIMIDVASALEYLHFGLLTPVIHCDIKPSNVLLDENMVAHLSDFGIAKLLSGEDQSMSQTQTLATIGYIAPEYGIEGRVSTGSDVYSYGIMLMETFTRKKPTHEIFSEELSLKRWVGDSLRNSFIEVVDTYLLSGEEKCFATKEQCVLSILHLAMECTVESPEKRINAIEIVTRLLKIRERLFKGVE